MHTASTVNPKEACHTLRNRFEFVSVTQIVRLNPKSNAASKKEVHDLMEHITPGGKYSYFSVRERVAEQVIIFRIPTPGQVSFL